MGLSKQYIPFSKQARQNNYKKIKRLGERHHQCKLMPLSKSYYNPKEMHYHDLASTNKKKLFDKIRYQEANR